MLNKGWSNTTLGEISVRMHQGINTAADKVSYVDSGFPILQAKHITSGAITFDGSKFLSESDYEVYRKKYKPNIGNILFSNIGTIGKSCVVKEEKEYLIAWNILLIELRKDVSVDYVQAWLKRYDEINYFDNLIAGNATKFINKGFLESLKILLPPLLEQQKIAEILSTVDDKLAAIEGEISATATLKKGLMQTLLTQGIGHTQFKDSPLGQIPESWEAKKLGVVLKVKHGKSQKNVENPNGLYPILGTGGLMSYADDFLFDKPSVLIGRKGTINKPQYMDTPFWTVDTLFYTDINVELVLPKFMFFVFQTIPWLKHNEASGVPSLSSSTISGIQVVIPPLKEQNKIAEILSTVDNKLDTLATKKSHYQTLKKGLMQKLLTGEVRVKVSA